MKSDDLTKLIEEYRPNLDDLTADGFIHVDYVADYWVMERDNQRVLYEPNGDYVRPFVELD